MGESIDFIKDRATKTISAAKQLAPGWVWQEMSPDDMLTALTAIIGDSTMTPPINGQEQILSEAEQTMLASRGMWDGKLDLLHRRTVQAVGILKNRYRDNSPILAVLAPLTANSNSRAATLAEALALE